MGLLEQGRRSEGVFEMLKEHLDPPSRLRWSYQYWTRLDKYNK